MTRFAARMLVFAMAVSGLGCRPEALANLAAVFSVVVTPPNGTVAVGATMPLTVATLDAGGNALTGRTVTWSSANSGLLTVNTSGVVTGVAAGGPVVVTATSEGHTGTAAITVNTVAVNSVTMSPTSATVAAGATTPLSATPRDAANNALIGRTITWSSANTAIATVNGTGLVSGVAVGGPVTITATSEGKSATSAITVSGVPVVSVTVSPTSASVPVGGTTTLVATPRDAGGSPLSNRIVTWSSSNTSLATVNASGVVSGVAAGGPVTITAASEGKSGTASITVAFVPVATVSVSPATANVVAGASTSLTATPQDAGGNPLTGRTVTWGSANTAVATVNGSGVVTGVAAGGPVTITATSEGQSGTSSVTVQAAPPPGNYTTVRGNDWQGYANTAALVSAGLFGANDARFSVANNIAIVPDNIFGQVVRMTQPQDPSTTSNSGWTPMLFSAFPTPLDRVWYRFKVRFSPGWTTAGPYPVGAANSYKLAFITWVSVSARSEIEFSNTSQYIIGFSFQGISCSGSALPGSVSFGNVTTEWSGGEWWEFIMSYEKLSATSASARFWRRQLTAGGALVNNAYSFQGEVVTGCNATVPQARGVNLGANKNKTTPADQHIYWGPWEVVDGSVYPNPFGVGP